MKKNMVTILKHSFLYVFLFFYFLTSVHAVDVSFQWDQNTDPDLAGYRIFCREKGQSYRYPNPSWEGTDTTCTIYDLDQTKTYYFVSRAFDIYGLESIDSNELVLEPATPPNNQPPIANAGPDQTVNEGEAVLLNSSNSTDPDDGIASYHWVQIGDPTVNLSDPHAAQATFTAVDVGPEGAALTFEITVADYNGLQSKDSCVVNVTWQNEPPQANAGFDQTVSEGSIVTLDGSYSLDIDDGIESYSWNQISGPVVTLSNPASWQSTFTAPNVESNGVSLTFNLMVIDAGGLKNTDSCIVNISLQNEPPTAVVTPDYIETTEGSLVTLDGSASTDSDDGIDSYLWSQVEGDPVSLSDPTLAVTTFTAPKTEPLGKNIKLKLTVKDHGGLQDTADSFIYVIQNKLPNISPAVDFSYDTRKKLVTFNDRSTDSDGTIVSWFWDFGDGDTSTEQNPRHRYVKIGDYSVTLTVTDDGGANNSTFKNITVTK